MEILPTNRLSITAHVAGGGGWRGRKSESAVSRVPRCFRAVLRKGWGDGDRRCTLGRGSLRESARNFEWETNGGIPSLKNEARVTRQVPMDDRGWPLQTASRAVGSVRRRIRYQQVDLINGDVIFGSTGLLSLAARSDTTGRWDVGPFPSTEDGLKSA